MMCLPLLCGLWCEGWGSLTWLMPRCCPVRASVPSGEMRAWCKWARCSAAVWPLSSVGWNEKRLPRGEAPSCVSVCVGLLLLEVASARILWKPVGGALRMVLPSESVSSGSLCVAGCAGAAPLACGMGGFPERGRQAPVVSFGVARSAAASVGLCGLWSGGPCS